MRRTVVLLVPVIGLVLLVGCDGEDEPSRSPEVAAQTWVEALNAEDYERACELSVVESENECVKVLKLKPFGKSDLEVEGFYFNESGDGTNGGTFAVSSAEDRQPRAEGWTAYAPLEGFNIERHGNEYLVHWEVSIIK